MAHQSVREVLLASNVASVVVHVVGNFDKNAELQQLCGSVLLEVCAEAKHHRAPVVRDLAIILQIVERSVGNLHVESRLP
jgi:hypothetical protein